MPRSRCLVYGEAGSVCDKLSRERVQIPWPDMSRPSCLRFNLELRVFVPSCYLESVDKVMCHPLHVILYFSYLKFEFRFPRVDDSMFYVLY